MIFQVHSSHAVPNVIAVRGIARQVGTTSIAANLALTLARRDIKTLLLDLSLWNCGLTRSLGFEPSSALIDLARELDDNNELSMDSIDEYIRSCRPNLDLLPGAPQWLESLALRGENGWNFVHNFFLRANERWDLVIVDLGSHSPGDAQRDPTFLIASALHASVLQASSFIVGVCDSIEYLKLWQAQPNQDSSFQNKTIYVVNHHRSTLPFGLDRYKVDENSRAKCYFFPSLQNGVLQNQHGLFFMDRMPQAESLTSEERQALRTFHDIAARVNHQIVSREVTDRFTESIRNQRA